MGKTKLAVYGTLKRGKTNHFRLGSSTFLGDFYLPKEYTLYYSGLPFVKKDSVGQMGVHVELYEVDNETLRQLDLFEGHPHLYTRAEVPVYDTYVGMRLEKVQCYLYDRSLPLDNPKVLRSF